MGWNESKPIDYAALTMTYGVLAGLFGTEVALSSPSPTAIARGLTLFGVGAVNTTAPGPFGNAAGGWNEYAEDLTRLRDELGQLIATASGNPDSWSGDSADAFSGYAEGKLIEGMNALIELSDQVAGLLDGNDTSAQQSLGIVFGFSTAIIVIQAILQAQRPIPFVGEAIFQGGTLATYGAEIFQWSMMLILLVNDAISYKGMQGSINDVIKDIESTFGSESDRLDGEATRIQNRQLPSIIDR